jgi:hypothetical protein
MLLRTLSQPRPRYVIPTPSGGARRARAQRAALAAGHTSPKDNAASLLAIAFVFWLVYFLMRQFAG